MLRQQWKEKSSTLCWKNIEPITVWCGKASEIIFDGVFDAQG